MGIFSLLLFVFLALISPADSVTISHKKMFPNGAASWLGLPTNVHTNAIQAMNVRGGGGDINNVKKVQCLLRGKTYDVSAETVAEVKKHIQRETGFSNIHVFFRGEELLDEDMALVEAGIENSDILSLNVREKKKSSRSKSKKTIPKPTSGGISNLVEGLGGKDSMEKMMQQMGMEGSLTPEKMEEQMKSVLANPQVIQMLDNPLVMEQSRQQIMQNPMMMKMFESMGMGEVFNDPKAYAEHMSSVKEMLKDPELLKTLGGTTPGTTRVGIEEVDDFDQGDM